MRLAGAKKRKNTTSYLLKACHDAGFFMCYNKKMTKDVEICEKIGDENEKID